MIIHIWYISYKRIMMKVLKRNQIVIFAIALMLITAGYLNYTMSSEKTAETSGVISNEEVAGIGDAKLVSTENVISNNVVIQNNAIKNNNNSSNQNCAINQTTSTSVQSEETNAYFTESKLERENMYSEMLASYQSVLASASISAEQKNTSQNEISSINSQKNAIMIAENLIKNKGFKDVVIFVNKDSVSVVVKSNKLEQADIAQIQSIVQRELKVDVANIHISNK